MLNLHKRYARLLRNSIETRPTAWTTLKCAHIAARASHLWRPISIAHRFCTILLFSSKHNLRGALLVEWTHIVFTHIATNDLWCARALSIQYRSCAKCSSQCLRVCQVRSHISLIIWRDLCGELNWVHWWRACCAMTSITGGETLFVHESDTESLWLIVRNAHQGTPFIQEVRRVARRKSQSAMIYDGIVNISDCCRSLLDNQTRLTTQLNNNYSFKIVYATPYTINQS